MPSRLTSFGAILTLLTVLLAACSAPGPSNSGGTNPPPGGDDDGPGEVLPTIVADAAVVTDDAMNAALQGFELDLASGEGELRFDASVVPDASLEPGSVLVSDVVEGHAPAGYLQRVISVREEGGVTIVETEQASLTDVLEQGSVRLNQELTQDDVESTSLPEGARLVPAASIGYAFGVELDEVLLDVDGNPLTTDDQLTVSGQFDFNARAVGNIDIGFFKVNLFETYVRLEEAVDLEVLGTYRASVKESVTVASIYFGSYTVMVGPVPVVFVIAMDLEVGAEGEVEASLRFGVEQSLTMKVGAKYTSDNGWRGLNDIDPTFAVSEPEFNAAASLRGYVRPEFGIRIYDVVGPYIYAEAYAKGDAELFRTPFWELSAGVGLGVGFELELPVVGEVASWEAELIGIDRVLSTAPNAPPVLTVNEPNDGIRLEEDDLVRFEVEVSDREDRELDVVLTRDGVEVARRTGGEGSEIVMTEQDLCVGVFDYEVVVTDSQGATASETRTVIVENGVPTVSIREDLLDDIVVAPGYYVPLKADVYDRTCTAPGNGAIIALTTWTVNGSTAGATDQLLYRVPTSASPGDTLTFQARYDDGTDVGSASVTLDVVAEPQGGSEPVVQIREPEDGSELLVGPTYTLEGYAFDPASGVINGASYTWKLIDRGQTYTLGTGSTATLNYANETGEVFGDPTIRLEVDVNGTTYTDEISVQVRMGD